ELARLALGGFKGALSNPPHDWINSKVILILGSEIASEVMLMGYLLDARERGAKIICIDTKYTQVMMKSDYPVLIKPGSFHLLLYGIVNRIINEGQYDNRLLERWTEGFSEIMKASLSYDQARIAERCGIQREVISSLSTLLAKNHPIQVIGSVRDDQVNGPDGLVRLAWLSVILLAINNSLGVKGGGWNWLGTGSLPVAFDGDIKEGQADDLSLMSIKWQQDHRHLLEEIIEKDTCQALIWDGCIPDEVFSQELIEALSRLKLVVHLSDQENPARKYSHVSFPVTNWLEEEGPVFCSHYRAIQWRNQVSQTPGERKSAGLFWLQLAAKMGYEKWFPWKNKDNSIDVVRAANFFVQQTSALNGLSSLAGEDLTGGGVLWPHVSGQEAEFADKALIKGRWLLYKYDEEYPGTDRSFPTDSGKIKLSNKMYQAAGWGLSPFGSIESEQQDSGPHSYSLVCTSTPGFLGNAAQVMEGRYVIGVNPAHAEELKIRDGDRILLEKGSGNTFEAPAWVTEKIALSTVGLVDLKEPSYYARFCYRGGWVEGIRVNVKKLEAGER
ncbi:MAG TPA: molybdopterin-dependent oxidoreductase, partial [Clostridia bacterium]|nr:molybdopterin-dependent oxidoreductase [Clostridia bacterium]